MNKGKEFKEKYDTWGSNNFVLKLFLNRISFSERMEQIHVSYSP